MLCGHEDAEINSSELQGNISILDGRILVFVLKIMFQISPHPNPLPQGEREVMCNLTFASPPLMGGD